MAAKRRFVTVYKSHAFGTFTFKGWLVCRQISPTSHHDQIAAYLTAIGFVDLVPLFKSKAVRIFGDDIVVMDGGFPKGPNDLSVEFHFDPRHGNYDPHYKVGFNPWLDDLVAKNPDLVLLDRRPKKATIPG